MKLKEVDPLCRFVRQANVCEERKELRFVARD